MQLRHCVDVLRWRIFFAAALFHFSPLHFDAHGVSAEWHVLMGSEGGREAVSDRCVSTAFIAPFRPAQHRESVLKRRLSYHPVSVKDFRSQLHQRYLSGEMGQEFALLQEHSETIDCTKTKDIGHADANNSRNRFVDIVPCKMKSLKTLITYFMHC
jgi:hypothetical protein